MIYDCLSPTNIPTPKITNTPTPQIGYIENCLIIGRKKGPPMFTDSVDGWIPQLSGYLIAPLEELDDIERLKKLSLEIKNHGRTK